MLGFAPLSLRDSVVSSPCESWCHGVMYVYLSWCHVSVQEHSEGLSERLGQREAELEEATALIAATRSELTVLRDRAKEHQEVPERCHSALDR